MNDHLVNLFLTMPLPETGVSFTSSDLVLNNLVAKAEKLAAANIVQFSPDMQALIEGGGYSSVYTETQPMGGEMYAKRNPRVALNNQLFFMLCQRADGRLPGVVLSLLQRDLSDWKNDPTYMYCSDEWISLGLLADFGQLSGNALPYPAFKMYFLAGKPEGYLQMLAETLEAFDAYLWRTRDPNGEGVLQTWCVTDTGEDGCRRFGGSPNRWPHDYPPVGEHAPSQSIPGDNERYWGSEHEETDPIHVPMRSMDMMAYSHANRATLALISEELGDGKAGYWHEQAQAVRQALKANLWRPEKGAAYDKDRNNQWMETLTHNNLRCMHYGVFDQEMADEFIRRHLLNPEEFLTPVPLPSIAANDPLFWNAPDNNWSGAPQGLTWQRTIAALENYGHFAELTILGRIYLKVLKAAGAMAQQFDPFDPENAAKENKGRDGYGPTVLGLMEYVSRFFGLHLERDHVYWSGLADSGPVDYRQQFGDRNFELRNDGHAITASINGEVKFTCTAGARVHTDLDGRVLEVIGIDTETRPVSIGAAGVVRQLTVAPNEVHDLSGAEPKLLRAVPYYTPLPFTGKYPLPDVTTEYFMRWKISPVLPGEGIAELPRPIESEFATSERSFPSEFINLYSEWKGKTGHAAFFGHVDAEAAMDVELRFGEDGPVRVWIGEQEVHTNLKGTNPAYRDVHRIPVRLPAGRTPVTILMALNGGKACGFFLRMARPYAERVPIMPQPWR
ncbi:MAG: hypothetical protein WCS31_06305 [Verrucomicrobiae bacterium]